MSVRVCVVACIFFRGGRGVWGRGQAFLASAAAGEKDVVQGTKDSAATNKLTKAQQEDGRKPQQETSCTLHQRHM